MAFPRAAQAVVAKEVIIEYAGAQHRYSEAQKKYLRLKRLYENATAPLDKLKFYEAREEWTLECRVYRAARLKYQLAVSNTRLAANGVDPQGVTVAELAASEVKADMRSVHKEAQLTAVISAMPKEQFDAIAKAAAEYSSSKSAKEQFLEREESRLGAVSNDEELDAAFEKEFGV